MTNPENIEIYNILLYLSTFVDMFFLFFCIGIKETKSIEIQLV